MPTAQTQAFASVLLFGEGATSYNTMFAQWPGEVLFESLFFIIQFITFDNFPIFNPATSQTQTLWPIALGQMRYLATLLLFFVILVDSWAQTDRDVFKQVFIDFVLKDRQSKTGDLPPTTVIILNKPSHDIKVKSKDFGKYRSNYKKLDRLTFEDFVTKCQDDLKFSIDTINNLQTVIVDKSSFNSVGDLYKLYPNFHLGLIELTNVGFNPTRTQALVYYGYQGGPMTGGGVYIVYIKKRTRWKVAKTIGAWAS